MLVVEAFLGEAAAFLEGGSEPLQPPLLRLGLAQRREVGTSAELAQHGARFLRKPRDDLGSFRGVIFAQRLIARHADELRGGSG